MVCKKCDLNKEESNFHKKSKSESGYQIYCKSCTSNIQRKYYKENIDKILDRKKNYRSTNSYKEKSRLYELEYSKVRKENGKTFKVKFGILLRDIVWRCLHHKGTKKSTNTYKLLGYDTDKLKQRIECQFKDGMCWENHGKWHIDHKKPISRFSKDSEISTINSLCNLQPLWAKDNLSKGNRFETA